LRSGSVDADSHRLEEADMASGSVYVVNEIVGTSTESWEDAARTAIATAAAKLRDLRVGEVVRQDVTIEDGKIASFRVRLNVSFRYEG
jgi:flavin-binding protein dodecin